MHSINHYEELLNPSVIYYVNNNKYTIYKHIKHNTINNISNRFVILHDDGFEHHVHIANLSNEAHAALKIYHSDLLV